MSPDDLIDEAASQCLRGGLKGRPDDPLQPALAERLQEIARGLAIETDHQTVCLARRHAVEHWLGCRDNEPADEGLHLAVYVLVWAEEFSYGDLARQAAQAAYRATSEGIIILRHLRLHEKDRAARRRSKGAADLLAFKPDALAAAIELTPFKVLRMGHDWDNTGVVARQLLTDALGLRLQAP